MKTVSLEDAQKDLLGLVAEAEAGEPVTILVEGRPRATLSAVTSTSSGPADDREERRQRHKAFLDNLGRQPALGLGKFDRSKLYEE